MALTNFYAGATKKFTVTITLNGAVVDIRTDAVKILIKESETDLDSAAILDETADVTTSGISGIASFNLTPTDTDVVPGSYWYEIYWTHGTDVYVLEKGKVQIMDRVKDV